MPEEGEDVFFGAVVDRSVPAELATDCRINRAFVRHDVRGSVDIGHNDRAQGLGADIRNMKRSHLTVELHQRNDGSFIDWSTRAILAALRFVFIAFLAANVGFVYFNDLVLTA